MDDPISIKRFFTINPQFVADIIHTQYLKTNFLGYQYDVINIFNKLENKTEWVDISLILLENAISYEKINNEYIFECEKDELGIPKTAPFYTVFRLLLRHIQGSVDSNDMLSKLYASNEPLLIKLAEDLKNRQKAIPELFDLIHCKECDLIKDWHIDELLSKKWNFKLLALNEKVWDSIFGGLRFSFYLRNLENGVLTIKEKRFSIDSYREYVSKINLAIKSMFMKIHKNPHKISVTSWTCSLCDGNESTGCLWHDPTECPRNY